MNMSKKQKYFLLITSDNFPFGSAGANLMRLLCLGLAEHDWQVHALIQKGKYGAKESSIEKAGRIGACTYCYCGYSLRPKNIILKMVDNVCGYIVPMIEMVRRRKSKPVVFIYNSCGVMNALFVLVAKGAGLTIINYVPEWYEKATVVKHWWNLPRWWDFVYRMKRGNFSFNALCMPSFFLSEYYKERGFDPSKLYVIPNLVEHTFFQVDAVESSEPEKNVIRIGYCGTPYRKDGIDDLLDAFSIFHKKHPQSELLVIGDNGRDRNCLSNIKKRAADLGFEEHIICTGRVEFSQMPTLLQSCDVLVLARPAGIFAEAGFPTKLGEYLACKKPVVVTRVGDIPRYLEHGISILLANPDDPASVAEQFEWILNHPTEVKKIAEKGFNVMMSVLEYKRSSGRFQEWLLSL